MIRSSILSAVNDRRCSVPYLLKRFSTSIQKVILLRKNTADTWIETEFKITEEYRKLPRS